jgi:6-phosphogluconolactonase
VQVVVRPSADLAAGAAAEAIASHLCEAITLRGRASLALSGGASPVEMVRRLAECEVDWNRVELFQVDERAVPAADPARNWLLVAPLAAHIPEANLHAMPVEVEDGDAQYRRIVAGIAGNPPVLDVVHLGLGADGHTASLVPGDPVVVLSDRDVAWVGEYRGHRRMTLTAPVLRAARHQVWLVAGVDKASALAALVSGRSSSPAAQVVDDGATVFADAAAATSGEP